MFVSGIIERRTNIKKASDEMDQSISFTAVWRYSLEVDKGCTHDVLVARQALADQVDIEDDIGAPGKCTTDGVEKMQGRGERSEPRHYSGKD